mmetsp:Transcript_23233/g.36336  ORF Transcript_23233/g.36336 Transcript_23233/m.36336 type:complete len:200 (+) Transcript_23233:771-1370(+)
MSDSSSWVGGNGIDDERSLCCPRPRSSDCNTLPDNDRPMAGLGEFFMSDRFLSIFDTAESRYERSTPPEPGGERALLLLAERDLGFSMPFSGIVSGLSFALLLIELRIPMAVFSSSTFSTTLPRSSPGADLYDTGKKRRRKVPSTLSTFSVLTSDSLWVKGHSMIALEQFSTAQAQQQAFPPSGSITALHTVWQQNGQR